MKSSSRKRGRPRSGDSQDRDNKRGEINSGVLEQLSETERSEVLSGLLSHVNDAEASNISRLQACRVLAAILGGEGSREDRIKHNRVNWKRLSKIMTIQSAVEEEGGSAFHDEVVHNAAQATDQASAFSSKESGQHRERRPSSRRRSRGKSPSHKQHEPTSRSNIKPSSKRKTHALNETGASPRNQSPRRGASHASPRPRSRASPRKSQEKGSGQVNTSISNLRPTSPSSPTVGARLPSKAGVIGVLLGDDATNVKDEMSTHDQLGYTVPMMWYPEKRNVNDLGNKTRTTGSKGKPEDAIKLPPIAQSNDLFPASNQQESASPKSPSAQIKGSRAASPNQKSRFSPRSPVDPSLRSPTRLGMAAVEAEEARNPKISTTDLVAETFEELEQANDEQLESVLAQEAGIWSKIDRDIRLQRLTFPTDFLLGQGLEVAYSREVARKVMERLFNYAGREPMRAPFRRLHENMLEARFKEFAKYASYEKVRVVIKRMLEGRRILGWNKWVQVTAELRLAERTKVAVNLQRKRRGILGRRKFAVHKERWYASRKIQTQARKWKQVGIYLDLKRRTIVVQKYARTWAVRIMVQRWHEAAVPIQAAARMFPRRWEFLELKAAALIVSANYRGVLARVKFKELFHTHMAEFEQRWVAAEMLQYFWRLVVARRKAQAVIDYNTMRTNAALKIQTFWYQYMDALPSFIMMRGYLIQDEVDKLNRRDEKRAKRDAMATRIQTVVRRRHAQRLLARLQLEFCAARLTQALVRSFVARQKVKRWRRINQRVRSIQRMIRAYFYPRHHAARLVQSWWKKVRLIKVPRYAFARSPPAAPPSSVSMAIAYAQQWHAKTSGAVAMQRVARGYAGRCQVKKIRAALRIQCAVRSFFCRLERAAIRVVVYDKVVRKFVGELVKTLHLSTSKKLYELRQRSATIVQSWYRMCKQKQYVAAFRKFVARRNRAARQMQRVWRGFFWRRRAKRDKDLLKRVRTNRFRSIDSPLQIAQAAIKHARAFYDVEDSYAGMHPAVWLHRIGLSMYWKGLQQGPSKISDLSKLLMTPRKALANSGVDDEAHLDDLVAMQRITKASDPGTTKLGLPSSGNFHETFSCDSHERLLLQSLAPVTSFQVVKDMYLSFFPNQKTRAINFATKLQAPASGVTYVQLWRYLCHYNGRPKEAKDNLDAELLQKPDGRAVAAWQVRRFKQCFAIYEMAVESISKRHLSDDLRAIITDALRRSLRPGVRETQQGCNELRVALTMVVKSVLAAEALQRAVRSRLARAVFFAALKRKQYREDLIQGGILKKNWELEREKERKEWESYLEECRRYEAEQRLAHITRFPFSELWDDYSQAYYYIHETGQGQMSWERPVYTYNEDKAALQIQRITRGLLARLERERLAYLHEKELKILRERLKWEARAEDRLNLVTFRIKVHDLEDEGRDGSEHVVDSHFQLGLSLSWRREKKPLTWSKAVSNAQTSVSEMSNMLSRAQKHVDNLAAQFEAMRGRIRRGRLQGDSWFRVLRTGKDLRGLGVEDVEQQQWELHFEEVQRKISDRDQVTSDETDCIGKKEQGSKQDDFDADTHGQRIDAVDEDGNPILDDMGDPVLVTKLQRRERKAVFKHRIFEHTCEPHSLERRVMELEDVDADSFLAIDVPEPSPESVASLLMAAEDAHSHAREAVDFGKEHMPHLAIHQDSSQAKNSYDLKVKARKQSKAAIKLAAFARGFLVRNARWRVKLIQDKRSGQVALEQAQKTVEMAKEKLASLHVAVRMSSEYTFVAMQFGWTEKKDGYGRTYFVFDRTAERTWERPVFVWEHEAAARFIQRVFRGWCGRVKFIAELRAEGIPLIVDKALRKAKSQAWVGYGDEGISVNMWFARRGLYHILKDVMGSKPNSSKMLTRNFRSLIETHQLPWTAKTLEGLGITDSKHIDQVLAYQQKYPLDEEAPVDILPLRNAELARKLFLSHYSSQGARAIKFSQQAALMSDMPITMRQLVVHLEKYKGKPSLATVQLQDEVFNLPVASTPTAEESSYYTMVGAVKRVMIVAANMKITKLCDDLKERLSFASKLLTPVEREMEIGSAERSRSGDSVHSVGSGSASGTAVSSMAEERLTLNLSQSTSESFFMSNESIAESGMIIAGESTQRLCLPPGPWHCKRKWPRQATAAHAARLVLNYCTRWETSAIIVQRTYRDYYSLMRWRETAAWYRNKVTTIQCAWRQYAARKLVKLRHHQFHSPWEELFDANTEAFYYFDNRSQRSQWHPPFVPYRPHGWWPPHPDDVPVPEGMCYICRTEEAVRRCNECVTKNQIRREFCFECYARVHDFGGLDFATHTFEVVENRATEEDNAIVIDEATGAPALTCGQCRGPASRKCDECKDFYCISCFRRFHNRGKRVKHAWTAYNSGTPVCVECEADVAEVLCIDCDEQFCKSCFADLHRKGQRRRHKHEELPSFVAKRGQGL